MRERRIQQAVVSITKSKNEQQAITDALDLLPMEKILHPGDKVVITPNWVNAKSPSTGTVVGPESLRELIQYVKRFHPAKVIVATGSGGEDTNQIFKKIGYDKIIAQEQVEFVDLNYGPYIELELEHNIIKTTPINKLIDNLDVLISFAQLKQHEEATMTASIKNIALGWPPAEIHGFPKKQLGIHEDLHGFIVAMAKKLPIDLSIISADKAMIGTGPSGGVTVDTEGLIIASTDPVAADTIGARLLGYKPQGIQYLYTLYKAKLGEADPQNMDIKGIALSEAEKIFSMAAYGQEIVLDKMK
jgi:uncharacterized protein (DUF362 family)